MRIQIASAEPEHVEQTGRDFEQINQVCRLPLPERRRTEVVRPREDGSKVDLRVGSGRMSLSTPSPLLERVDRISLPGQPSAAGFLRLRWVALRLVPWGLFLLAAFGLLPARWSFERLPETAQTVALIAFGLFVLVDTSVTVWSVALRKPHRRHG